MNHDSSSAHAETTPGAGNDADRAKATVSPEANSTSTTGSNAAAGSGDTASASSAATPRNLGAILGVYLTGLLVGGLYVGMVAPARTVIQNQLGVGSATGIWMINVYTLFYAALIPAIGKLADSRGRNKVFAACILVFMAGAALCGLADYAGGLPLLLIGRVIQAAGASGMIPVANAEIGTSFPPEKRGMALGIAAGVTGISNALGAGVGSALIGALGAENWAWLFWGALPVCLALFAAARVFLREDALHEPKPLDTMGSLLLVATILLLLAGLRDLDFFNLASLAQAPVWAPLAGALVCAAAFAAVERRTPHPLFRADFLRSRPIAMTLVASFFIGWAIVSMMLVPEFAEFATGSAAGSGGYYIMILGAASMIGPPMGGKLIDRIGPKKVLLGGLAVMAAGFLFLAFRVAPSPSTPGLVIGLAAVGLGMGFAMGAPTNYMILENVTDAEAASAMSAITLARQVGTTLAPSIFVGLIASAPAETGYQRMLVAIVAACVAAGLAAAFYRGPQRG